MYILWFSFHGARASFLKSKNEFFAKMQKSQKMFCIFGGEDEVKKRIFFSKCLELRAPWSVKISFIFEKFVVRTWWVLVDIPISISFLSFPLVWHYWNYQCVLSWFLVALGMFPIISCGNLPMFATLYIYSTSLIVTG